MCPVSLPEWIEQPVPAYDLDPIHDAIGKFVRATKALEFWLAMTYAHFDLAPDYAAATRKGPGVHLAELLRQSPRVPAANRDTFTRAMRDASEIAEIRNAVIHGIGFVVESEIEWRTQRPNRGDKSGDARWREVDYDRDLLIGAGRRARQIAGFLQVTALQWFDKDQG